MKVVSRWDALSSPIPGLLALSVLPSVCAGPDCGHTLCFDKTIAIALGVALGILLLIIAAVVEIRWRSAQQSRQAFERARREYAEAVAQAENERAAYDIDPQPLPPAAPRHDSELHSPAHELQPPAYTSQPPSVVEPVSPTGGAFQQFPMHPSGAYRPAHW
ncbi:hypothetical protein K525DRAFT_265494 [Schizophyllum commune Loenen D]|nr:hypothetical protein K525DRAFT_265494 [Schizophyllum commune Loenen D]